MNTIKYSTRWQCLVAMVFISFSSLMAQTINWNHLGSGEYSASVSNAVLNGATSAFWLFGDGEFGYRPTTGIYNQIPHSLMKSNHTVEAYLLEGYKTQPPSRYAITQIGDQTASNANNAKIPLPSSPSPVVTSYLKSGTSWNPVRGAKHFTMITFANPSSASLPIDGKIIVNFLNNLDDCKYSVGQNNQNWANLISISANFSVADFTFFNLKPGEQRHIILETEVNNQVFLNFNYTVEMRTMVGDLISQISPQFAVRSFPHDPNEKLVSEDLICTNSISEVLTYTINFQNEGAGVAEKVVIRDELPSALLSSSLYIIDRSHSCYVTLNQNVATFVFPNINLPGLGQIYGAPPTTYKSYPKATKGFVTFAIKTTGCLPSGMFENTAGITFDTQAEIMTQPARTDIEPLYNCNLCNKDPRDGEDGGDKNGNNNLKKNSDGESSALDVTSIVNIYPNPVEDLLYIEFEGELYNLPELFVYNTQGKLIANLSKGISIGKGQKKLNVDVSNWSSGIYFVKLRTTKEIQTWKVIKL